MKEYNVGKYIFRPGAIVYLPKKIVLWVKIQWLEVRMQLTKDKIRRLENDRASG